MKPRTQAELDAFAKYPGLEASMELAEYCERREDRHTRAYATGLGTNAHAEAQEAGRQQDEFTRGMKFSENRGYIK